jgi:hypothetical protein
MNGGRPTDYSPEMLEKAKAYFDTYEPWYESPIDRQLKDGSVETRMERLPNPPPSILDLSRILGVARSTLYLWMDSHEEFSDTVKKGIERLYPEVLQENAILGRYAPAFAIFAAKNRMKWTDKQEVTGADGTPIAFSVAVNFVEPNGPTG